MAWRLDDLVVCGEIINRRRYSTHGWVQLRGIEHPLRLELTGDCDADLRGRHLRFEAREGSPSQRPTDDTVPPNLKGIAWQQVGPTCQMTAERQVRVPDCPLEEFLARSRAGDPPPTQWKRCLHLEWSSQNGRMVIELVDPVLEFIEWDGSMGADGEPPPADDDGESGGLQVTAIEVDEDGHFEISDMTPDGDDDESELEDDPYQLFSNDLQDELDRAADATDRALAADEAGEDAVDDHDADDDDASEAIRELELMDDLIEHGEAEPVGLLFDTAVRLPRPDQLSDDEVEPALKTLLAQLALCGIALDVCEHYSPRDAYRLLIEEICVEQRGYRQLRGTQWVQHFMTHEFCPACEEKAERDYQEYEKKRKRGEDEAGDDPTDDADAE
jgi:hypothetical protein